MKLRRLLWFCLGLLLPLLAAELAFRVLPVSTATMRGYHLDPDVLSYPPRHEWTVATGWDLRNARTLRSNDWGFAAQHDFVADPSAVVLIGDSYVEASMLAEADRPAAQLEHLLGASRKVYAMGSPGSSLLDYAQRIRLAAERLGTRDFVLLLERFDARQSLCGSGNVQAVCLDRQTLQRRIERDPAPGFLKKLLRHSALAQYLVGQIRFDARALLRAMFTRATPSEADAGGRQASPTPAELAAMKRMVDAVVAAFFANARPYLHGDLIVAVDGRRSRRGGPPELIDAERSHLMQRLREGGAEVIDLETAYAAHAARSQRRLDVGPYDGHLNALGVRIAMGEVARALAGAPAQ
ncbi:MAG TPA: hypothetical protein PKJ45_13035 [Rubrivivax sp.]|nr:hypothetical protein [Rubrivivax sp.]